MSLDYRDVLRFWFKEIEPANWWKKDVGFDQMIDSRFGDLHGKARQGELYAWRKAAEGRLAEIIILDQFSRNIFRDTPDAFACDPMALILAQEAVSLKVHTQLGHPYTAFLLMPYMHSESLLIHRQAELLFSQYAPDNLEFEIKHKKIIQEFGRYPHRNKILLRSSTPQELEFLKQPDSSF